MFENISRRQFVTGSAAAMLGLGLVGCGGNGGGESAEGDPGAQTEGER